MKLRRLKLVDGVWRYRISPGRWNYELMQDDGPSVDIWTPSGKRWLRVHTSHGTVVTPGLLRRWIEDAQDVKAQEARGTKVRREFHGKTGLPSRAG